MDFQVTDNFLSKREFNELQSIMLEHNFPWYWNPTSAYVDSKWYHRKVPQFTHTVSNLHRGGVCSDFYPIFFPLLKKLGVKNLYILKANLNLKTTFRRYTGYHKDYDNIRTAVFYFNTNTGGTKFKNGKFIKSVENRLVAFDSNLQHTGVTCTKDRRVLLNINYT